ncbi:F-box only protein 48-like [Patiria miniata]|uniref:F-box domain-containing protein n=1 Tax=Patiria miniata TaxID=46514 RepID=A0A914BGJ0_PATMI|nr:F-box only protein 48-like [Patiria miniata]XP_038075213.1 F-box only protein 48-like [Patiria miniata]XP_038075214.1 F-box only protein 48-like [Patiria miniata]
MELRNTDQNRKVMSTMLHSEGPVSPCHYHCMQGSPKPSNRPLDLMQNLPPELYLSILLRLDARSLQNASQTCKLWNSTIEDTDWLWRKFCHLKCDDWAMKEIQRDRGLGYSWKESFIRTCGPHSIKRKWFKGAFSNLNMYDKNLPPFMCCMDVETWGQILELELSR